MSLREYAMPSRRSRRREKSSVSDTSSVEDVRREWVRRRPVSAGDLRLPEYRDYSGDEKGRKKLHRREKKITRNTRELRTHEFVMNSDQHDERPVVKRVYGSDGEDREDSDSETGTESTGDRVRESMRYYYTTRQGQTMSDLGEHRVVYNSTHHGRSASDVGGPPVTYYSTRNHDRSASDVGGPPVTYYSTRNHDRSASDVGGPPVTYHSRRNKGYSASEVGGHPVTSHNTRNHGRPASDVESRLMEYVRHDSIRERRGGQANSAVGEQILPTPDGDRVVEVSTREEGNKVFYNYRLKEALPPPAPPKHVRNVGVQMTTKYVAEEKPPAPTRNACTQTAAPPQKPKPAPVPIPRQKTPKKHRPKPAPIPVSRPKTPPREPSPEPIPELVLPLTPPPPMEGLEPIPTVIPKARSVMVRVGGGWMKVEHHRNHHIPVKVFEHQRSLNQRPSSADKFLYIRSRFARKKRQVPIAYKMYREKLVGMK